MERKLLNGRRNNRHGSELLNTMVVMPDLTPFLTAVRERLAKATPGPWTWDEEGWHLTGVGDCHCKRGRHLAIIETDCGFYGPCQVDRELIAHAPTDLRRLLALAEAGQEIHDALNEAKDWVFKF